MMANDSIQIDSTKGDSGTTNTYTFLDSNVISNGVNKLSTTIETPSPVNQTKNNWPIAVSILTILMTISIVTNVILLIILKKKDSNHLNDNHMEKNEESDKDVKDKKGAENKQTIKTTAEANHPSLNTVHSSVPTKTNERNPKERIRLFSEKKTKNISIYGISIQGKGHIADDVPCQDYHCIEVLDSEKNIAIVAVSDGAGSAKNSAIGSKTVCESSIKYLKMAIDKFNWLEELPNETVWNKVIREVVRLVQIDLNEKARNNDFEFKSLASTLLLLFYTPQKTYFAHIGDGRAGIKNNRDEWKSIMTPHKGEEANQTVFVTNEVLNPADLKISGVFVPETMVVEETLKAFIIISDGCEDGLWVKNKKENLDNGDFKYISLNEPFSPAIEKLILFIKDKRYDKQKENLLFQFIDRYNENLKEEVDDKTICIGIFE